MNPTTMLRCLACVTITACLMLLSSCGTMDTTPSGSFAAGAGPITSGLRSGNYFISPKTIDSMLGDRAPATARVESRPGLGTTAGQEQYSRLERARLIRKSSAPDAVDSFHYNDEPGARAMVGILGGSTTKHGGLFDLAGERLKAGLVRYGHAYPHYEASGKRIVIGDAGSHYEVRLENRTKKRLEIVLSVDGLNVLTGNSASPSQHGFVLEPRQTYDVDGFRKDSTTVRSFQFGSVAASKAAAKGGAGNVGVIGLAVFEEDEARAKAELQHEQLVRENANAFPAR